MFEVKFLTDCSDYVYLKSLDRDFLDSCIDDRIETLALVSNGVIYNYGPVITFTDSDYHTITISNDSQNHLAFFFGKLFIAEYLDINCLNIFFQRFIEEL